MKARSRAQRSADRPSFRLFLRVRHPSIDPAELTREFGTEPLHCFRAGDARAASGQATGSLRHADSYWLAQIESVPLADRNVGMAVTVLTMRLLQPHANLLRRLRAEEGEVTLLLELDAALAEPFTIAPQTMKLLADLGVTVAVEFGER